MTETILKGPSTLYKGASVLYGLLDEENAAVQPAALYTRQQIAELIGVGDDVLSFWIKNDLLQASGGGGGAGRHLKFSLFQVNIAAVLAELRQYGVNVGTLRKMAALLQRGTELGETAECNFHGLGDAADLAGSLHAFRAGKPVLVDVDPERAIKRTGSSSAALRAYHDEVFKPAESEDEILAAQARSEDLHDEFEPIAKMALRLQPEDVLPLRMFTSLNDQAYQYAWNTGNGHHFSLHGNMDWLIVPSDDTIIVYEAPEGHDLLNGEGGVTSGLFLAPGAIFRRVWGDRIQPTIIYEPSRSEEVLDRRRQARGVAAERRGGMEAKA